MKFQNSKSLYGVNTMAVSVEGLDLLDGLSRTAYIATERDAVRHIDCSIDTHIYALDIAPARYVSLPIPRVCPYQKREGATLVPLWIFKLQGAVACHSVQLLYLSIQCQPPDASILPAPLHNGRVEA